MTSTTPDDFARGASVWARHAHGGPARHAVPCGTWGHVLSGPVRDRYVVAWDNGRTTRIHRRHLDTGPDIDPTLAEWLEHILADVNPDRAPEAHIDRHPWGAETVDYLRGWDACLATVRAALAYDGLIHPTTTTPDQEVPR